MKEYIEISFDKACELLKQQRAVEYLLPSVKWCAPKWKIVSDAFHLLKIVSRNNVTYIKFRYIRQCIQKDIYISMDKNGNWLASSNKEHIIVDDTISCQKFTLIEGIFD